MTPNARPLSGRAVWLLLAGIAFLAYLTSSRMSSPAPTAVAQEVFSGATMGTTYTVKIVPGPGGFEAHSIEAAEERVAQALEDVNRKMSTYSPESELSRFNASASTEPFAMSAETLQVFHRALEISEATGGAFDITVGLLVNAWGFGPEERARPPSEAEIQTLLKRTGYGKLSVDLDGGTVKKSVGGLYCDLSAIAKGFAVDRAAAALEALGFENFLVEVGGETRAKGNNAKGGPWRIGIERPVAGERSVQRPIPLADLSIATSGDYRNYYEEDGVRLSHTIDPRSGKPISHALASVSVIHPECIAADAYATALMVLGPEDGLALAESLGLKALLLVRAADASIEAIPTSHFARAFGQ